MITVEISIKDKKNPPALKFPNRCANCGRPKEIVMPFKLNMGIQKRGQMVMMDMPVPLCKACEKKEHRVTYVTLIPFIIAVLLIGAMAFVPAWLIAPQGNTAQTLNFDVVFGAFVGLIVGLIGGTVVEFVLKILFAPVYGKLLLKRPLTILGLFNDSEDVIGLSAKFKDDRTKLALAFENDEIAREFKTLNPQEKS